MKQTEFDYDEIKAAIRASSDSTKIYVGCDSIMRKKFCVYATVIVIHYDGAKGCRVFWDIAYEDKPETIKQRMLGEAWKAAVAAAEVKESVGDRIFEVHLDINTKSDCGSHVALKEATGYVLGMVGIEPKFKPNAPCASHCADRLVHVRDMGSSPRGGDGRKAAAKRRRLAEAG